jgi:hypothetical protein
VDDLGSTVGIIALAAAGVAICALVVAIVLAARVRRLRAAQSVVLGDSGTRDLAEHASAVQREFTELARKVDAVSNDFEARTNRAEQRLDGAIAHFAVVRYDAYNEMSGRQSSSIALLDSHRSGVVLSSILHREQARLYAKQIVRGHAELDLSPEEQQALETALARDADGSGGASAP